jgi:integrase
MLKAVLSLYSDEVALPKDFAKVLSLRGCPSQNTWLTDEEIYKLIAYNPESPTEHLVRNQFVLEAVTGARHSDVIKFTRKNIVDDTLVYVSRKTHIKASIPLAPVVVRFLKAIDFISREVSTVTFNLILREICRKNGITEQVKLYRHGVDCEGEKWQFISSHSGRRSFASNLYLRGADLLAISKLMGHTDVKMTQGYIVCPPRLNDEILNYFKQFD